MSMRYEIRVIGDENYTSLGALLHTTESAAAAKAIALSLAGGEFYGVAVLDTVAGTVDWGNEVTPAATVSIDA
jgi:hypothetical protein